MFLNGENNPNWIGGKTFSSKGYIRIRTRHNRNMYEHRHIISDMILNSRLCADYVFGSKPCGKDGIPIGYHVNHADFDKTHNCPGNLQLLQSCIHNAVTAAHVRFIRENYTAYLQHLNSRKPNEVPF